MILGDEADWIKTQANKHFPEAIKILDWPHLWRKVCNGVRALQPGKRAARRAWRKEQYEVLLSLLWEGEREQALKHLRSLRPTTAEVLPPLEDAIRYLESQRDWIGNYQSWWEQGSHLQWLSGECRGCGHQYTYEKTQHAMETGPCYCVVALCVQRINAEWATVD